MLPPVASFRVYFSEQQRRCREDAGSVERWLYFDECWIAQNNSCACPTKLHEDLSNGGVAENSTLANEQRSH